MEERISQLEKRIKELEEPNFLNQKLKNLLITNGFVFAENIIDFQSMAGVNFLTLMTKIKNQKIAIDCYPGDYLKEFFADVSNDLIVSKSHGLSNGTQITFKSSGTLPAPISEQISYYVINANDNDFKISLTSGGTAINITDGGVGIHYWYYFT